MTKLVLEELLQINKRPQSEQYLFFNTHFQDVNQIQKQINNLLQSNLNEFIEQWVKELFELSVKDQNGELFREYFNLYQQIKYIFTTHNSNNIFNLNSIFFDELSSMSYKIALKYLENYFGNIEMFISSENRMKQIYNQILAALYLNNHFDKNNYNSIIIKFIQRTFKDLHTRILTNRFVKIDDYYFLCEIEKQNLVSHLDIQQNEFTALKEKLGFMIIKLLHPYNFYYKIYLFYKQLVQDNIITEDYYKILLNDNLHRIIKELKFCYDLNNNIRNPLKNKVIEYYFEIFQIIKEAGITELKIDTINRIQTPMMSYIIIYNTDTFNELEIFIKKCLGELWVNNELNNPNEILFIVKMLEKQELTPENLNLTQEQINTLLLRDLTICRDSNLKKNNHTSSIYQQIYYNVSLT